jgi:Lipid A 3-O-deacylase (PagL)
MRATGQQTTVPIRLMAVAVGIFTLLASASAQVPDHRWVWQVWSGGSIANGHVFGYSNNRGMTLLGVRLMRPMTHIWGGELSYKIDLDPTVVLSEPRRFGPDSVGRTLQRKQVFGAGAAPVGAEWVFRSQRTVHPFLDTTGGFLRFNERVFSTRGSQFNFTVDLGGGLQMKRFVIGYKYLHVSNANISTRNPGADFQIIYIGVGGHFTNR